MNPSCAFHPYWSFINPPNVFSYFQMPSYENYMYPCANILVSKTIQPTVVLSNNSCENQKQLICLEQNNIDKKKNIKKIKQDKNFSYRYQDKDRNIYSNILKGFVSKLRQDFNFQAKCQQYTRQLDSQLKVEDFIHFVDQNFQKSKTYISPTYIKKVLKNNEKNQIGKYLGLLLSKYLREAFTLVLLGSKRIQKKSKILQMKKARQLWALIYEKGDQINQRTTD